MGIQSLASCARLDRESISHIYVWDVRRLWTEHWTEETFNNLSICQSYASFVCWDSSKEGIVQIKAEESQMEEDQLTLHEESEERMQLLQEQKESLEERKKSIMKRIGKPNFST